MAESLLRGASDRLGTVQMSARYHVWEWVSDSGRASSYP